MAVSVFPAASVALTPEQLTVKPTEQFAVSVPATGTDYYISQGTFFGAGVYRLRFYPTSLTQPTVSIQQRNATFGTVGSAVSFGDPDTGSTVNFVELFLTIAGTENGWSITSNQIGYLVVEKTSIPAAATRFSTVTTVTTSGSIDFTKKTKCVLLGGGGGGGGANTGTGGGGGGGGSGYQTRFDAPAGSYQLVIGAGGAGVSSGVAGTGGSSTFSGGSLSTQVANGGIGGTTSTGGTSSQHGGAGGSGGGIGAPGTLTSASGGGGGSNGGSGGGSPNGGNSIVGAGSGVTLTNYFPTLTAGAGGSASTSGGGAGGLYAGGGGGSYASPYTLAVGGTAVAGTAGGGGGGSHGGAGGSGGSGALIYFSWD